MPLDPEVAAFLEREKALPPRDSLTVEQTRERYRRAANLAGDPPRSVATEDVRLPGRDVAVRLCRPAAAHRDAWLVYFHGGRFFSGDLDTHDTVCRCLAAAAGCTVAAVGYRLAPECRFPAAAEDAFAALEWASRETNRVAVGGDSAGGNLAAVASLMARDRGARPPACQLLIYPMLDATCGCESHRLFASGYGPGSIDMQRGYREYLPPETDPRHPYVSPLFAPELAGLPPTYILAAEYDCLRDEGEAYARRLAEAGVAVTLRRWSGVIHGFSQLGGVIRAGRAAIDEAAAYLHLLLHVSERTPVG